MIIENENRLTAVREGRVLHSQNRREADTDYSIL